MAGSRRHPGPGETDRGGGTEQQARELCLRLLTVRARSRGELAEALARRGYSETVVEPVLTRLAEVGLVDDRAFAEAFVRSRHGNRVLSRTALTAQLRRRGVDEETAADAAAGVDEDSEVDAARSLVRRRLGAAGATADPEAAMRRLAAMLARRGYPAALSYRVIREELAATGAAITTETGDTDPFE